MTISEVVGDRLMSFIAVVRCAVDGMGAVITRVAIRCDGMNQARHLLSRVYGRDNVLNIKQTVVEQSDKPAEPSKSLIPLISIRPANPS